MTTQFCLAVQIVCHFTSLKTIKGKSFYPCKHSARENSSHLRGLSSSFILQGSTIDFTRGTVSSHAACDWKVATALRTDMVSEGDQLHEAVGHLGDVKQAADVGETPVDIGFLRALQTVPKPESTVSITGCLKAVVETKEETLGDVKQAVSEAGVGETASLRASQNAPRQVSIQDLRIGSIFKGKVSVIESYGVFVDIGAYTEGFVHISRLGRSFVRRVEDVVHLGQDVTVQLVDFDLHANRISLMLRPEECFTEGLGLRTLTIPEINVVHRSDSRRANKLARRAENPLPRRRMSLETRQRLKSYRRAVVAERQAIKLHQARVRARGANILKDTSTVDEPNEVINEQIAED